MIGIGVKRTSGGGGPTFSLNLISALLQSIERFVVQDDPNPITPSFTLSRPDDGVSNPSMWAAPCAVVFSATDTVDTATTNEFRNCLFIWDYGDDTGEFWEYGARPGTQSKNSSQGAIGGHVYMNPGEYTITLHVLDSYGNYNRVTQNITVTDPDTVFSGTDTICFSNTDDFTGAPAGCVEVITDSYDTAWGYLSNLASGKRLLFKRDHTFTVSGVRASYRGLKNIHLGDFGSGEKPSIVYGGSGAGNYIFSCNDNDETPMDNISIYNLSVLNPDEYTARIGFGGNRISAVANNIHPFGRFSCLYCDFDKITPGGASSYGNAFVGCTAINNNMGVYSNGLNQFFGSNLVMSMFVGNHYDNQYSGEHVVRIQGGGSLYIDSNDFLNPSDTKHCFALRGSVVAVGTSPTYDTWEADTTYSSSSATVVMPTADLTRLFKRITLSGTTGATEPDWSGAVNIGDEVTDNTVMWRLVSIRTDTSKPFFYITRYANIRNNRFELPDLPTNETYKCTLMVQMAPGSPTLFNEPIEDVLFEGNYIGPNRVPGVGSSYIMSLHGKRITCRNNIINGTADGAIQTCISVSGDVLGGSPASDDVLIVNNSYYSEHIRVSFLSGSGTGYTNIKIKNTVAYAPGSSGNNNSWLVNPVSSEEIIVENSTPDRTTMWNTSPNYLVTPPIRADDFKLTEGSYAIGAGADEEGCFFDYFQTTINRVAQNMGAISSDS